MAGYSVLSGIGEKSKKVVSTIFKFFLYSFLIILSIVILKGILKDDEVVIQPISAPKAFVESGYQGNIIAQRLNEEIVSLYQNANTSREDSTAINVDQSKDINMNVMGLGISASNLIYHIRDLLGVQTNYITGHLTDMNQVLSLKLSISSPHTSKTIRMPYSEEKKLEVFDSLLFEGAKFVTEIRNPYRLAVYYHQQQQDEKSLEVIRKLLRSPGEKKWAFNLWGNIIKNTMGQKKSIEFYENALQEDPNFLLANRNIGYTYFAIDSLKKADYYFRKAYAIDPTNWQTTNILAHVNNTMGNNAEAKKYFELNLEQHPKNMYSYSNYGEYLINHGETSELKKLFNIAQAQNFENDEFLVIKSNYYAYQEKQDSADLFIEKALIYNPKNIDALATKANIVFKRDGHIASIPHLQALLHSFEKNKFIGDGMISTLNTLSICYYHAEKLDSSFYYINKAIDLSPEYGLLYSTLAEAHLLNGNKGLFYQNIETALAKGWKFSDNIWEEMPYDRLTKDQKLLKLFDAYDQNHIDKLKG